MLLGICISTAFAADTDNIEWILRYGGDCGKSNLSAEWQYHTHNQSVSDKYHNNRFTLTAGYGANAGVMENYVHKNYDFYSQYFDCKCGRLQRRRKCRYQGRSASCTVPCRLERYSRLMYELNQRGCPRGQPHSFKNVFTVLTFHVNSCIMYGNTKYICVRGCYDRREYL